MKLTLRKVTVTPIRQNCTILSDELNRAVIVDPGGESARLAQEVEGLHVEAILLTHGHLDHAGGAADLKMLLTARQGRDVPVIGPLREDLFLLERIEQQAAAFGLSGMKSVTPDRFSKDGDVLSFLGHEIEVAHVPGHTPGHVVFILRQAGVVIAGDTLFRGTVGRTDFPYGNERQLLERIRSKLFTLSDDMIVLPGHGLPTTIGEEKQNNPVFQH
ncbi:MBL fold metallo-hydrolase [Acetobacteraceae bacterium B3987]|nr:MBL fold metallo-hydrolase [Acetobacteraceae bacterium B3987]